MKRIIVTYFFLLIIILPLFSRPLFLTTYLTKEKLEQKISDYKIEKGAFKESDPNSLILDGVITFKLNDISYTLETDNRGRVETEKLYMNVESIKLLKSLIDLYKSEGFVTNDGYNKEEFDDRCCHTIGLYIKKTESEFINLDISGHWGKNSLGNYLDCTLSIIYSHNIF